jgi:Zn-dependent membrane protease YugP
MFFDSYYVLLVLPAIILSLFAQSRVQSAYNKYAKVYSQKGITGAETARRILASNGVNDVRIETTEGTLTDHYDPRDNVIRLSKEVYSSTSISAVGIAADTGFISSSSPRISASSAISRARFEAMFTSRYLLSMFESRVFIDG